MNRKIIFDDFEIRLNKIFEEGNPTKAQIFDALHKSLDSAELVVCTTAPPPPPKPPKKRSWFEGKL